MKGPGSGRESALRALQNIGFSISNIKEYIDFKMDVERRKKEEFKVNF